MVGDDDSGPTDLWMIGILSSREPATHLKSIG
jgi:hypothetical protein